MPNGIELTSAQAIERGVDRIAGRLEQIDNRIAGLLAAVLTLLERLDARKSEPDGEQSQAGRGEVKARLDP